MATLDDQETVANDSMNIMEAAAAFSGDVDDNLPDLAGNVEEETEEELPQEAEQAPSDDDSEAQEEAEEVEPPIDMPISWKDENAEEWQALPPAIQATVAERESQLTKKMQQSSEEAAASRRAYEKVAQNEYEATQRHSQQLEAVINAYAPQEPSLELLAQDPHGYAMQMQKFKQDEAQHQGMMQHVQAMKQQADSQYQETQNQWRQEQFAQAVQAIPELASDGAKELLLEWTDTAQKLGFDPALIPDASASEIIGMKQAHEWRMKAEKWEAAQGRQLSKARAARKANNPNTAQPKGSRGAANRSEATKRLKQSGSLQDAAAALPPLQ